VVEQRSEIDQKKIEIEQEVQRIREMMLKIQGKGADFGNAYALYARDIR
jgi:hypothetical protein